jgi:hypothetical protein
MVLEEEEEEVQRNGYLFERKKNKEKLMLDSAKSETEQSEEYLYSRM